jgi:hypothetical protein
MIESLRQQLIRDGELTLDLRLSPRRPENKWLGSLVDGSFKLALRAVPEDGAANQALIKFLASEFSVLPEQIKIVSGATSRRKLVRLSK